MAKQLKGKREREFVCVCERERERSQEDGERILPSTEFYNLIIGLCA